MYFRLRQEIDVDYTMPTDPYTTSWTPSTAIDITVSMSPIEGIDPQGNNIMIRESPTSASGGQVTTTQNTTDGTFVISSFSDLHEYCSTAAQFLDTRLRIT